MPLDPWLGRGHCESRLLSFGRWPRRPRLYAVPRRRQLRCTTDRLLFVPRRRLPKGPEARRAAIPYRLRDLPQRERVAELDVQPSLSAEWPPQRELQHLPRGGEYRDFRLPGLSRAQTVRDRQGAQRSQGLHLQLAGVLPVPPERKGLKGNRRRDFPPVSGQLTLKSEYPQ